MKLHELHDWRMTPQQAVELQKVLASQVVSQPLPLESVRCVAGVDVSVQDGISHAAVVVMACPDLAIIETVTASQPTPFPYVPGLLSFREGPVLAEAFQRLRHMPDAFLFDGMGLAHPRRLGIACHLGLWLQRPTLGCGKTHFIGEYDEPPHERGAWKPIYHHGEVIGAVLRTRPRVKPVYVSVGHLMDLPSAIALTMRCTTRYRLPEPIRAAHQTAGRGTL
jgi:deoxyribonuclease V